MERCEFSWFGMSSVEEEIGAYRRWSRLLLGTFLLSFCRASVAGGLREWWVNFGRVVDRM
jgi:hypothetical protein